MQLSVQESARLDAIIGKLKASGNSEYELLIEHLETAHAYLHGAMPLECEHNLKLAQQAAGVLPGKPLASELQETIQSVVNRLHSSAFPPQRATSFFQRAGAGFGIFYPTKHVVAVFPSFETAEVGHRLLSGTGFRMWETISVRGEEVEEFLEELRAHPSLWADLMREVSRVSDTDLVYRYARLAQGGAGFLVAYSPGHAEAEKVADLLRPLQPVMMHWFMPGYIRHLL